MKRAAKKLLAAAMMVIGVSNYSAQAAFFSYPRMLKLQIDKIRFETPTLAPLAYSRFCLQYSDDCQPQKVVFRRPRPIELTPDRMHDLVQVNREVNRAIEPEADQGSVIAERWQVSPRSGACHDYAVTKRHELLARGWPARSLLLAEVVVSWGEHHLVVVVRTNEGDLVLDNLTPAIKPWSVTPYEWVRVQSPHDPNTWMTIGHGAPFVTARSASPEGEEAVSNSPAPALRKS
jgi:predicted transglutaminase-like cysteine proteinase